MATTLNLRKLDEELIRKCKTLAASKGITLKQFIVDVLTQAAKAKVEKI